MSVDLCRFSNVANENIKGNALRGTDEQRRLTSLVVSYENIEGNALQGTDEQRRLTSLVERYIRKATYVNKH